VRRRLRLLRLHRPQLCLETLRLQAGVPRLLQPVERAARGSVRQRGALGRRRSQGQQPSFAGSVTGGPKAGSPLPAAAQARRQEQGGCRPRPPQQPAGRSPRGAAAVRTSCAAASSMRDLRRSCFWLTSCASISEAQLSRRCSRVTGCPPSATSLAPGSAPLQRGTTRVATHSVGKEAAKRVRRAAQAA
jgi:hypothetical protein